MSVCSECCVLSGRGLCGELITRPEEALAHWGGCSAKNSLPSVFPSSASIQGRPRTYGRPAQAKNIHPLQTNIIWIFRPRTGLACPKCE
jgi:hypothetical protein